MATVLNKSRRILVAAPTWPGTLGGFCQDALNDLGQNVTAFPRPEKKSQIPGLGGKLIRLSRYLAANIKLWRFANQFRPEILLVIKGEWIWPAILRLIRQQQNTILLNWNPDSPFNPVNSSCWLLQAIPVYDCHFTWAKYLLPELEKAGAKRVEYLPFAYDPRFHFPVEDLPQTTDICFIGTWEPEREDILKQLTDFNLGVWGDLWAEKVTDKKLRYCWRGSARYGREMCEIYGTSRIVLNLIRKQNQTSHNMRTFEVPATKSCILTTRTEEQNTFLEEDKGMACFAEVDELKQKINYFLTHSQQRERIAQNGHIAITTGEHTYLDRMKQLLHMIGE